MLSFKDSLLMNAYLQKLLNKSPSRKWRKLPQKFKICWKNNKLILAVSVSKKKKRQTYSNITNKGLKNFGWAWENGSVPQKKINKPISPENINAKENFAEKVGYDIYKWTINKGSTCTNINEQACCK